MTVNSSIAYWENLFVEFAHLNYFLQCIQGFIFKISSEVSVKTLEVFVLIFLNKWLNLEAPREKSLRELGSEKLINTTGD